ncbi:hypothetical protein H6P81_017161 [Aristolochia fimbriata]|uniref:SKP1 component dimerisation domain-containing protein n=1 Tax=Aristolochia fimbriata TaxID=158543 RepID=A0AAV7DXL0_ARIFI|nr:hypothetical protein H6P81_017161 [Aristolochia fimbriata]
MASTVLTLQTHDGVSFQVERAVAFESPIIRSIVESGAGASAGNNSNGGPGAIRVPTVSGGVLRMSMDYVGRRRGFLRRIAEGDVGAKGEMQEWEAAFFGVGQGTLLDLVEGAHFLGLAELREAACGRVADAIKGKSVAEIRRLFNIRNDYTPEEEEAPCPAFEGSTCFVQMADEEKDREESSARGNEWEVVSLTASTYAAAPDAREVPLEPADSELGEAEESARAMFLSGHFVFPPNEHENLPLEPDIGEINNELTGERSTFSTEASGAEPPIEEEPRPAKSDEDWNIKGLTETDEVHGVQFFDDKCKSIPMQNTGFEEGKVLQGLGLVTEEESMYSAGKFRSFHGEAESSVMSDPDEQSQQNVDSVDQVSKSPKSTKVNDRGHPDLPCQAWWKRHITTLYSHAKETNALWSVVVAAALMGLVILGQRWQQERWQLQQLRWHDEKMNRVLGPISRFKDVLVGGQRRSPAVRGSLAAER